MNLKHLTFAFAIAVAGAAPADEAGFIVENDVAFGDLPRQTLDIYSPELVGSDTPVLIFFYGGGFSRGSKANIRRLAQSFVRTGMVVVAPNYRLYPEATFPQFVEDAALAVSFVWHSLRVDEKQPRQIFIGGWSAGAYISAMVAYDRRYLDAVDTPPHAIKGFIGLAGPYQGGLCAGHPCPDIFPEGTEADWPVAKFLDASDPPMILVRGTRDLFVDKSNLEDMAASGEMAGISVTTLVIKDAFHEDLMSEISRSDSSVREAVDAFLEQHSLR